MQIFAAESARATDERLDSQINYSPVDGFEKTHCSFGIAFVNITEIAECIHLGIVSDEEFALAHLERLLRVVMDAK